MSTSAARTYNQTHVARPADGKRRISIYWAWSYPWEAQRDPAGMTNRFSTMTEVRNVTWPAYEKPEYEAENFLQGIAGTLELFHLSSLSFQRVGEEVTGHPVAVFQRVDQAGVRQVIDDALLADCDTFMIYGLDHLPSEQHVEPAEIEALEKWLERDGTCLMLSPHHDVGFVEDREQQQIEYRHHGDALVPRQQRFSSFVRDLMKALDVPVLNKWGLRPARVDGDTAPIHKFPEADELGLLAGVPTLNFHMHLPHYELLEPEGRVRVLAKQPIDLDRPHPFTAAGNTEFNVLLWMPPEGRRKGDIVLVDMTHFTTLFGGTESLERFWRNFAGMRADKPIHVEVAIPA